MLTNILILAAALLTGFVAVFLVAYKPRRYSDVGTYGKLYDFVTALFAEKYRLRDISAAFSDFSRPLAFPFSKIFGAKELGVLLKSFESENLALATASLFEVPPGSAYHSTVTINILPRSGVRAPIMHIDFLKASAGVPGMFILDFFNVAPKEIALDAFFGKDTEALGKVLEAVSRYQRSEDQGRGKISRYLDPYKSPYRLELLEPASGDHEERKAFYIAALEAVMVIVPLYLKNADRQTIDPGFSLAHKAAAERLIEALREKDFAAKMGRGIFRDDFAAYWEKGFWDSGK